MLDELSRGAREITTRPERSPSVRNAVSAHQVRGYRLPHNGATATDWNHFLELAVQLGDFRASVVLAALVAEVPLGRSLKLHTKTFAERTLKRLAGSQQRVHEALVRLAGLGLVSLMVHRAHSTTVTVAPDGLCLLFAQQLEVPRAACAADPERFVRVLHGLRSHPDALVLVALASVTGDDSSTELAHLAATLEGCMDRFKVHRALKRLAGLGLVQLQAVPRVGTRVVLDQGAFGELLAQPLPDVRYLAPGALDALSALVDAAPVDLPVDQSVPEAALP